MNSRAAVLWTAVVLSLVSGGCRRRRSSGPDPSVRLSVEFGRSNDDPSVAQPEFPVSDVYWTTRASEVLDATHSLRTVRCPAFGAAGPLWGTDVYTADSSVCTAALHSGLIDVAQGGVVQIVREGALAQYRGSVRNGVRSSGFAAFPAAFRFSQGPRPGLIESPLLDEGREGRPQVNDPWARNMMDARGQSNDEPRVYECPAGGTLHTVWGTDVYTDDSSVCSAAVHAGVITVAEGGTVRAWHGAAQFTFVGSAQRGVTSSNYGRFDGSFAFDRAAFDRVPRAPEGTTAMGWNESMTSHRDERVVRMRVWCPPNGTVSTVWGTDVYTDDSSVCTAAVHVGLITVARGGVFAVSNAPGRTSYQASERNGVTTQQFAQYQGSFRLSR